jgi:hypothetical protein
VSVSEATEACRPVGVAGSEEKYASKCAVGERTGEVSPADGGPAFQGKSISVSETGKGAVCRMSFMNGCSVRLGSPVRASNMTESGGTMYSSVRTRFFSVAGTVTAWVVI